MKHYQHHFHLRASIERVAAYHQDTRTLKQLSPPPIFVSLNHVEPIAEGSISDFTMWLGPLPVRWVAVHSQVDPIKGFTDTQRHGPFEHWEHRHIFRSVDADHTEVIDEIRVIPGKGIYRWLISHFMWLGLPVLFAYREWRTRRAVEG